MYYLLPEILLNRAEFRRARHLLKRERLLRPFLSDLLAGNDQNAKKLQEIDKEIASLSERVLRRELGLHRYMVVKVCRDDGFAAQFQVLTFSIDGRGDPPKPYSWYLDGRILRKNGTLGETAAGVAFDCAVLSRRALTGDWVTLIPRKPLEKT
jgi:hypothetical protein